MIRKNKKLSTTSASESFEMLKKKDPKGKTKLNDIVAGFYENGFALVTILFSIPIAVPLPYPPGFTTFVGIPLIILAAQMILGYKTVKLPKWIGEYEVKNSLIIMVANKVIPLLVKFEQYLKPRLSSFASSTYAEQFVGIISLINAVCIAIPLPFTNAIPAAGTAIMSLGLLRRDSLTIGVGLVVSAVGDIIAFSATAMLWLGMKGIYNVIA